MVIYVEYSLIDNLIINSLLLSLTNHFLKLKTKRFLIFLSALIGALIALISPIMPAFVNYILKVVLAFFMPLLITPKHSIKKVFLSSITFFVLTMLFIGFCLFFCFSFNLSFVSIENGTLLYNFPVGLALFLCCFIYFIIKSLIISFFKKKHINDFCYKITLFNNSITYSTNAFLDSGNFLMNTETNSPVSLINLNAFTNIFPDVNIASLLLKNIDEKKIKNAKYVNVGSIGKKQEILIFEIPKLKIENYNNETKIINNICLGLSLKNFSNNLNAECILNYNLFLN